MKRSLFNVKGIVSVGQILIILLGMVVCDSARSQQRSFADHWKYVGIAIEEPGYQIWGSSPIMDEEGKVHLFAARWTTAVPFEKGWRSHSEIAHYVADRPEGPFKFVDVVLKGTGRDTWDKYGMHNPTIHKVGHQYVLLFIANNDYNTPRTYNQRIGMALSESLYGPWKKVGADGMILAPSTNPDLWTCQSPCGVNNPAFLPHPNGGYMIYFKAMNGEKTRMGVAFAEHLEGPYVQYPLPVTANNSIIEDGYAFLYHGKFCLLTTDNHGMIKRGGGILWKSDDGLRFTDYEAGFHLFSDYIGMDAFKNSRMIYGGDYKFERPQLLLINGEPAYLYVPSGVSKDGKEGTASHVLKYVKEEEDAITK